MRIMGSYWVNKTNLLVGRRNDANKKTSRGSGIMNTYHTCRGAQVYFEIEGVPVSTSDKWPARIRSG